MRYPFVLLACLVSSSTLFAQETSNRVRAAAGNYVDANTLAVGYIDLDAAWIEGFQQEAARHLGDDGKKFASQPGFAMARGFVESFRAAGARELVGVVSLDDLNLQAGPIGIITTEGQGAADKVRDLAVSLSRMASGNSPHGLQVAVDDQGNVLFGQRASLERYQALVATPRPDLTEPLAEAVDGAMLVVAPGSDARRVVRELWPPLSKPFDGLTGALLADDARHLVLRATRPPEWSLEAKLVARTEDAAAKFNEIIGAGYQLAVAQISTEQPELASVAQQAAKLLAVTQQGQSLSVRLTHDNKEAAKLIERVMVPAVQDAREAAFRNQRTNQMKHFALAMHMFHDRQKQFPASAAIVDKDGKPLLSWRVAVLPYLEGQSPFNQFRFDEPWDSPHNIKLVKQMPEIYASPNHPELTAEGKTVYQVPFHDKCVFSPVPAGSEPVKTSFLGRELFLAPGRPIKEITDGTSNTVMIVEVAPEDAVVWTKPADWEVDLARAWQQLKGDGGKSTVAAYCDGSAHAWDHGEDRLKENLPKLITRAGGEIVEW